MKKINLRKSVEMLSGFMALYNYFGPLAPGLNFVKNSLTYLYSLFISSFALHVIAERLASVTADTSFKVFGLTRLRIESSLYQLPRLTLLTTRPWRWWRKSVF